LRSGSGALVGPVGVLDVAGGRTTRLGWSDSGKLVALPRTAGERPLQLLLCFVVLDSVVHRCYLIGSQRLEGWSPWELRSKNYRA
jgi:hypothetical protein